MLRSFLRCFWALLLAAAAVSLAPLAIAQVTTTGLRGVVRDSSGAVIPNASLKLKDTSTEIEKTALSGPDGGFLFANLLSGTYTLTASLAGFQTATLDGIVIDTGRTTDVTVQMNVGSATETVEVSA